MGHFFSPRCVIAVVIGCCISSTVNAQPAASVQLLGTVDLAIVSDKAPGAARMSGLESGKMTTSYFAFRGTENLGNGLNAVFALESFFRADSGASARFTGDAFFSRNAYVGFQGNSGTIAAGLNATPLFSSTLLFNAFGSSFGFSPTIRHYFTSGTVTGDTVWANSVVYRSPALGKVSGAVMHALGEGDGGSNSGANVLYLGEKFGATGAYQRVRKGAAVADTDTWNVGAYYDFGGPRTFLQLGRVQNRNTSTNFDLVHVSASVPFGTNRLLVGYGTIEPDLGAKRRTMSLSVVHAFSKRTDAYVAVMSDKINNLSSGHSVAVGTRVSF